MEYKRDSKGKFITGTCGHPKKDRLIKKVKCKICKCFFIVNNCDFKHRNVQFCSKKCYGEFLKGKYPKGIKKDDWKKSVKTNISNGTYKNNSLRMMRNGNPNWRGGKSRRGYLFEFNNILKEKIIKRDCSRCQECGKLQELNKRRLDIHHIDYNKNNNGEENLISLCSSCHTKTNFNRKDWIKYFLGRGKK